MADLSLNVPAIEKLVDYTAIGVGAVTGPMLANWKASKEGRARLTSARFDADVRRVEAESRGESLVIIAEAQAKARQSIDTTIESGHGVVEITPEDITQSIEFQGRKRLANVASVVEDAADELGNKEVPDHEPDPDWTARFFDCVQDVSSEDMQKLWGKILAGEVESPGRTSIRTQDTLRNMTKKDAEMFGDICNFVIGLDFVFYDSAKDFEALKYSKLLHLQDCSLINVGLALGKSLEWKGHKEYLSEHQGGALMITSGSERGGKLNIPAIRLTAPGTEISRFVPCTLNMRYLQAFSRFLQSKDCQLHYLENVVRLPDGRTRYSRCISIEPDSGEADGPTS